MANLNSLHSCHFFKIILIETIKNESLELPSRSVKEHGSTLSNTVWLRAPTGPLAWRAELKRRGCRAWLHKGWQDFVEYYSIKCAYFLVFRYEGESCFVVSIFNTTTFEIQYPLPSNSVDLDRSKPIQVDEEHTDDDNDNDNDDDQRLCKSKEKPYFYQSSEVRTQHSRSAWEKVIERAKAFKSPNPCFIVKIHPYHVTRGKCCLYVPQGARSHFLEKENNGIYLNLGEDGRSWFVKYSINDARNRVCLSVKGWGVFMRENRLQVGDVCVFELVDSTNMVYKVTIFRIAEYA